MALPRSTITSTLVLLGMGVVAVIGMLIFAFSLLNSSNSTTPTIPENTNIPAGNAITPTPEYIPNPVDENS